MENENKDKAVLNDEELKKVAGGFSFTGIAGRCKQLNMKKCNEAFECKWEDGKCVQNTKNS